MSTHRYNQLENLLHRLRQRGFDCPRCEALIPKVKTRLMDTWRNKQDAIASERMLRLWS